MQFAMVPYNLLRTGLQDMLTQEMNGKNKAKIIGNTKVIASSEDTSKNYEIPSDLDYLHLITHWNSNKVSYAFIGSMICDMSSDIFSRKVNKIFYLIYAAQKHGCCRGTMVMVRILENGT